MLKHQRLYLLLLCAAVALVMIVSLSRNHEPSYDGQSLSHWLVALTDNSPEGNPERAEEAIRQIGTNAIPLLVRYASYTPPPWQSTAVAAISTFGKWLGRAWYDPWNTSQVRGEGALMALGILGPSAASAIPELTRLMNSPNDFDRAKNATFALGHLGGESLPPLMTVLTNPQSPMCGMAALSLSLLGTNARPAVPILIGYLRATNMLAACAATSLGMLRQEPHLVVPALTQALHDPRPEIRCAAAHALEQFGDQARSAQPALLSLLNDTDDRTRYVATNALRNIAPKALPDVPLSDEPK
jgi:HEAT repeat protein